MIPIEQQIDTVFRSSHLGMTLLPFACGISWDRGVGAAIPATGPISFDPVRRVADRGRPRLGIFIIRSSRELGAGGEVLHLAAIGIGNIHHIEWISGSALVDNAVSGSHVLQLLHWRSPVRCIIPAPKPQFAAFIGSDLGPRTTGRHPFSGMLPINWRRSIG